MDVRAYMTLLKETEGVMTWSADLLQQRVRMLLKDGTTWWSPGDGRWYFMGFWDVPAPGRWYVKGST